MREDGFYWVKSHDEWHVAEWRFDAWWICGNEVEQWDKYFQEIDENRIIRHDDKSLQ